MKFPRTSLSHDVQVCLGSAVCSELNLWEAEAGLAFQRE